MRLGWVVTFCFDTLCISHLTWLLTHLFTYFLSDLPVLNVFWWDTTCTMLYMSWLPHVRCCTCHGYHMYDVVHVMVTTCTMLYMSWLPHVRCCTCHGYHMYDVVHVMVTTCTVLYMSWLPHVQCCTCHGDHMYNVVHVMVGFILAQFIEVFIWCC